MAGGLVARGLAGHPLRSVKNRLTFDRISSHLAEWDYARKCHFAMTDHVPSVRPARRRQCTYDTRAHAPVVCSGILR